MKNIKRICVFVAALTFIVALPVQTYAATHTHSYQDTGYETVVDLYDATHHAISRYKVVTCSCGEVGWLLDTSKPNFMVLSTHSFYLVSEHSGGYHYQYNRCSGCGYSGPVTSWRCTACPEFASIELPNGIFTHDENLTDDHQHETH